MSRHNKSSKSPLPLEPALSSTPELPLQPLPPSTLRSRVKDYLSLVPTFYKVVLGILGFLALLATIIAILPETQRNVLLINAGLVTSPTTPPTIAPTALAGEAAKQGEIVVVVAQFEQTSGADYTPDIDMLEVLQQAASQMNNVRIISIDYPIHDRNEAQQISDIYQATMIVYGRSAPGGVTAHYEIIPRFSEVKYQVEGELRASTADIENFDAFLYDGMDANYILGLSAGQLAYFSGDYPSAMQAFSLAATSINPDRAAELDAYVLYFYLGIARFDSGDLEGAITDYTEAIRLNPDYAFAYSNRGVVRYNSGDLDSAMADYTEAIRLNPDMAEAYYNRGLARSDNSDLEGAMADYTEAIRLNPDDATTYYNRGIARYNSGDLEGAMADYTEAIRLNLEYADAYYNRGFARSDSGDLKGAMADYTEAIRLNLEYADAYNNRGVARATSGDLDGAIADFNEAIRLNPDDADAYYNRGNARSDSGDLDGAMPDYTEAIRLNPNYANAYTNQGIARYNSGDLDGAIANYTKAIRLNPDDATAYNNRGIARYNSGDLDGAIADYHEYERITGKLESFMEVQIAEMEAQLGTVILTAEATP